MANNLPCSCGRPIWAVNGADMDQCQEYWEAQEQAELDDYDTVTETNAYYNTTER